MSRARRAAPSPISNAYDPNGHGTHTAGIEAATDPEIGVATHANLIGIRGLPAPGEQRPLHRHSQIVRGIGQRLHPVQIRVGWNHHPGKVPVIGPGLQCLGPPGGQRHHRAAQQPCIRQPRRRQRLGREHQQARRPGAILKHDAQAHAQVSPRPGHKFDRFRCQCHGVVPVCLSACLRAGRHPARISDCQIGSPGAPSWDL